MRVRVGVVAATWLVQAGPAWACAVCATGDPSVTTVGIDKPTRGRVRLATMAQYRYERAPVPTGGTTHEDEGRLDVTVAWSVTDAIVLTAQLPLVTTGSRTAALAWTRGWGLGDAGLGARFVVGRSPDDRHLGGLTVGGLLPTSPRLWRDGSPVDVDAQPGTGSWASEIGAWYGGFLGPWTVLAGATGRLYSPGHGDVRPGPVLLASAGAQWAPILEVALRLTGDVRWADVDRVAGVADARTGGWVVQATPSLLFLPNPEVVVSVALGVPVGQRIGDGTSREGLQPRLGVIVDL